MKRGNCYNILYNIWLLSLQFSNWVDAVVFVFSLENEASFQEVYKAFSELNSHRSSADIPLIVVGTQGMSINILHCSEHYTNLVASSCCFDTGCMNLLKQNKQSTHPQKRTNIIHNTTEMEVFNHINHMFLE